MRAHPDNPLRTTPNPHLLELNARTWLERLSRAEGRALTLAEIPQSALVELRRRGFHGIWLMGVWTTGAASRRIARSDPQLRAEYDRALPGWTTDDVGGSPYSIQAYEVPQALGGDDALAKLRTRLHELRLGLVLDFVPNHLGRDHPWLDSHPKWFVGGTPADLRAAPGDWFHSRGRSGEERIFAHGREADLPGWTDTVQLDYRHPETRRAMTSLFLELAQRCDGLRCDVAGSLLKHVFARTWRGCAEGTSTDSVPEFWAGAIRELRERAPDCVLIAEAYDGLEPALIEAGFDFAYDRGLKDALAAADFPEIRRRLTAPAAEQRWRVHFLENHDERRALTLFGEERLRPAAALLYSLPGMRFFQDGQADGRRVRVPVQLTREPEEPPVRWCGDFHERLLSLLAEAPFHGDEWSPLPAIRARSGRGSVPGVFAHLWRLGSERRIVIANLGSRLQRVRLPLRLPLGMPDPLLVRDDWSGHVFQQTLRELRQLGMKVQVERNGFRFLRLPATAGAAS